MAARRVITVLLLLVFIGATWGINTILPTGFIPTEDQGVVYIDVTTPAGATVERTERVLDQIEQVASDVEIVEAVSTLAGYSLVNGVSGASFGMGMVSLRPWDDRTQSAEDIIALLREKTQHISDAQIEFFSPPTVPGFGNSSGFELRVLDQSGRGDLQEIAEVTRNFIAELKASPAIENGYTNFDASFPQYLIHVDQDMAAKKGITVDRAMSTLQNADRGVLYV